MCMRKIIIACYFAVFWTILQTAFHALYCLGFLLMATCRFMPTETNIFYYTYFTYLYNDNCGHNIAIDFGPDIKLPEFASMANVTHIFMKIYFVLDMCWVVASVALSCGLCFRINGTGSLLYYFPWVTCTGLILIIDTFCAVKYGINLLKAMSTENWLIYIGVENVPENIGFKYDARYWQAVMFMSLFYIRFGGIIINLILFFNVWLKGNQAYEESVNEGVKNVKKVRFIKTKRKSLNKCFQRKSIDNSCNTSNKDNGISTDERIRRWEDCYGELESQNPNISQNNQSIRRTTSDNQIRDQMPWSYSENRNAVTSQLKKLTHSMSLNNSRRDASTLVTTHSRSRLNVDALREEHVTNF